MCERVSDDVFEGDKLAVDGCGIPVYATTLRKAAVSFARLATLRGLDDEDATALARVASAMANEPWYVAGTGRFDTDLMRATGGRIVCKAGAEGVHCDALLDAGLGLALKVDRRLAPRRAARDAAVARRAARARAGRARRAAAACCRAGEERRRTRRRRGRRARGLDARTVPQSSNPSSPCAVQAIVVDFFLRRPIFASVFSLVILLLGLISIPTLPIAQFPNIAPPTVTVTAVYQGASAEAVESSVTTPLEEAINGVQGLRYIRRPRAATARRTITCTFNLDRDLDRRRTTSRTR